MASPVFRDLSTLASAQIQALRNSLPSSVQPHVESALHRIQQYLPWHVEPEPPKSFAEKLAVFLTSSKLSISFLAVLGPLLILVFSMSSWWPSGRYSPFGFYNPRGPPPVTEDDFSYLSGEEDRHRHHNDSHHSSHHQSEYGFPRYSSRTEASDLDPDVLILKYKGTEYRLRFPPFSIAENLKVGDLRRKAAKETNCDDPRRVKLLYKGRTLRDDDRYCHEERLKQNSEVMCVISSDASIRKLDDGDDSSSSASSTAIANGVELTSSRDNGSDEREPRSSGKRKNHRGGAKRRNRDNSNKDPPPPSRSEEPYRDTGSSYLHPTSSSTSGAGTSDHHQQQQYHRAPSPMRGGTGSPRPASASGPTPPPVPPKVSTGPLGIIETVSYTLRAEFIPKVQALLANPPAETKTRQFESKKLSESILTQVLFKLDGVQTEDEGIKAKRKECVKEANMWLAELDRLEKS